MTIKAPVYYKPGTFRGISSSVLKIIAVSAMFCDHFSVAFFGQTVGVLRLIGRIAFPIFAFMIAEGASRTRNIYKYMLRLLVFGVVSEIPFDLVCARTWCSWQYQNVYFTLLLGLIAIWAVNMLCEKNLPVLAAVPILVSAAAAELLRTDYGAGGVICIVFFYVFMRCGGVFRKAGFILAVLVLTVWVVYSPFKVLFNSAEFFSLPAVIIILLYNGEKGFRLNKYFFYGFYPAHLLILGLVSLAVIK